MSSWIVTPPSMGGPQKVGVARRARAADVTLEMSAVCACARVCLYVRVGRVRVWCGGTWVRGWYRQGTTYMSTSHAAAAPCKFPSPFVHSGVSGRRRGYARSVACAQNGTGITPLSPPRCLVASLTSIRSWLHVRFHIATISLPAFAVPLTAFRLLLRHHVPARCSLSAPHVKPNTSRPPPVPSPYPLVLLAPCLLVLLSSCPRP